MVKIFFKAVEGLETKADETSQEVKHAEKEFSFSDKNLGELIQEAQNPNNSYSRDLEKTGKLS